jgi:hypothetical protein
VSIAPTYVNHLHYLNKKGFIKNLLKFGQYMEAQGAIVRKYKNKEMLINGLVRTIVYMGLLIPHIQILFVGLISLRILAASLLAFKKSKNFIIAIVRGIIGVPKDIMGIIGFWRGFINKRQRL